MSARRRGERGTSMVEMALVLPTFLLLVVGMLDFGLAVYARNALANAARDGARFASVDPNNTTCIASVAAQRSTLARLDTADVDVDVDTAALGQPVTVSVESQYTPITPMVEALIGGSSLTLRASATMRIRNVPSTPLDCTPPATPTPVPPTATPPGTPPAITTPPVSTATPAAATPTAPAATATPPAPTATAPAATATASPASPTATAPAATPSPTPCVGPPGQCKKD